MSDYKLSENKLITYNFQIEFKHKINKVELINDIYLVMLEIPKGSKEVDNLYGVKNGKILWRIQSVGEAFNIPQNTPYISLKILNSEKAQVTSFFGMRYTVEILSGRLLEKESVGW